jgi:PPK2 family polyphosphate:nucleotide phosphotransferase
MAKADRKTAQKLAGRYRVPPGKKFHLKPLDPSDTAWLSGGGKEAKQLLEDGLDELTDLQTKLYAQNRWGVLVILQGMDASGKDSTIKHVMSGVNPQGVEVFSFKAPSSEELDHDYLWRAAKRLPERGRIGIFNRSYYEEVLVVRVHRTILEGERLPSELVTPRIWKERYEDINAFERYLSRNGYLILKFFLNVSRKEQKRRLLARLEMPEKNWKFSVDDVRERRFWNDYTKAYEEMIAATSTEWAPWHVVPADKKWFTHLAVATAIVAAIERLNLAYPKIDKARRKELSAIRAALS